MNKIYIDIEKERNEREREREKESMIIIDRLNIVLENES
jgi:hypothetical protein